MLTQNRKDAEHRAPCFEEAKGAAVMPDYIRKAISNGDINALKKTRIAIRRILNGLHAHRVVMEAEIGPCERLTLSNISVLERELDHVKSAIESVQRGVGSQLSH